MPRYEYRCDTNGRTIEVSHPMSRTITSWGELAETAEIDPGATPTAARVERVVSLAAVGGSKAQPQPCARPDCCMRR